MLKNYTPHDIKLFLSNGETDVLKPEGLARCTFETKKVGNLELGLPIYEIKCGEVYGLPEEQEGTYYIVSRTVAEECKGKRNDLFVPADTVRDEKGNIIGCKGVARI